MKFRLAARFASASRILAASLIATVLAVAPTVRADVLTVTSTADSGPGSLRTIVNGAVSGDIINFTNTLSGQTITLTSGQINLSNVISVDASSLPGGIVINGNASSRVFQVFGASTVLLDSLTITNGRAAGFGNNGSGAGILNSGDLTVNRCTLVGNVADYYGGGIETTAGSLMVNESTFTANQNGQNGSAAVDNVGSITTLSHCTVTANIATNAGGCGGVGNYGGFVTLSNSIVAGNASPGTASNLDHSIIYNGVNLTNLNPLLAPLYNYGGRTSTMPPLPTSPAIDAATNGTTFTTDQRGRPRTVGAFADLGAVEGVLNPAMSLTNVTRLGNGTFRFGFNNLSGPAWSILASTNAAAPLNTWTNLGSAVETPPGTFLFTDSQATNFPKRFYRVVLP